MSRIMLATGLSIFMCSLAAALVGDPQIMTDHPVYRGELSCSTLDRNIADAYRIFKERYGHEPKTDTEKLVALWAWKSEHYMHASDNKVYVGTDNLEARQDRLDGQPGLPDDAVLVQLRSVLQRACPDDRPGRPCARRPEASPALRASRGTFPSRRTWMAGGCWLTSRPA